MEQVLITGGTGLVGKRLKTMLEEIGYQVAVLSRSQTPGLGYLWNPSLNTIDSKAISESDHIIHLAGAGVADERWSEDRKKIIYDSRIQGTNCLIHAIKESANPPKSFISASAIGYYGFDLSNQFLNEDDKRGSGFLADVTSDWEDSIFSHADSIRTVALRIGIVLAKEGGALKELNKPPVLAPLGSGKQWMPWIHIDDLCKLFIHAMTNHHLKGAFNAVAPNPVTNKEFNRQLSVVARKPMMPMGVPGFLLKLIVGEMGGMLLGGSPVSSSKTRTSGFVFEFEELEPALTDLIK